MEAIIGESTWHRSLASQVTDVLNLARSNLQCLLNPAHPTQASIHKVVLSDIELNNCTFGDTEIPASDVVLVIPLANSYMVLIKTFLLAKYYALSSSLTLP